MDSSSGVFSGLTIGDCWSFSELMVILIGKMLLRNVMVEISKGKYWRF